MQIFQNDSRTFETSGLLSLSSYTKRTGISAITAWRWRRNGWLPTVNISGRAYLRVEDIAEFERRAAAGEFSKHHRGACKSKAASPSPHQPEASTLKPAA